MNLAVLHKQLGNIFLRVYLGMFIALVTTLAISVLLVQLANNVRQEAYHERQLSGLFITLTEEFSRVQPEAEHLWLSSINEMLGTQVQLVQITNEHFSRRQLRRLKERRPLLKATRDGQLQVFFPTHHPEQLLTTQLGRVMAQQTNASIYLLLRELRRLPDEQHAARLQQLQDSFAYPIELLQQQPEELGPLQLRRLERGEQVLLFSDATRQMASYAQISEQRWLKLGPVALFNPYPLPLLTGILIISLLMLAISIWWFLYDLESRLRSLERASTQLAAGNLKTRVDTSGKDFVSKLAIAFNRMAEQVQRLLRTQQEMIHAVSHELRTPVARIRFGLQMIEDTSADGGTHEAIADQIQGIDRDIDELDTLIDEILTYARLGQEKLQLQFMAQDVSGLLEEVLSGFQRTHPDLQLSLRIINPDGLSPEADLEGRYFQRAIQNLVGNAVRYAQQRIQVTCQLEDDTFRVDVEDDGPGIPHEDWERVFMPFSRLDDSRTRSSGGYGLGLSIVQRIIYWHRGSALVDCSPHLKGARFSLIFPRQQSSKLPPLEIPPQ